MLATLAYYGVRLPGAGAICGSAAGRICLGRSGANAATDTPRGAKVGFRRAIGGQRLITLLRSIFAIV
jgi:hypothetical protein